MELLGGLAVKLSAFVTLVSLPMAAVLLMAIFTVHLQYGFSLIKLLGVTPAGARFGLPGSKSTFSTWRAWFWAVRDRSR